CQRELEFAACIGQCGGRADISESISNATLPGGERHSIGQEADDWDEREPYDASADRDGSDRLGERLEHARLPRQKAVSTTYGLAPIGAGRGTAIWESAPNG